jgi:hypothetical protein
MTLRVIIWSITLGLLGAAIADYSTYDTSGMATIAGAALGMVMGAAIGFFIQVRARKRRK